MVFAAAKPRDPSKQGNGIGFAFSGAGGRISQHAAMMEVLIKGMYPGGTPIIPDYVSGVSSGAISVCALSAIMETIERNLTNGINWDDYHQILWSLQTNDVYDNSVEGLAKILTYNIFEGYFLDSSNLRAFLTHFAEKVNYHKFGDLYFPTCLTVVNQSSGLDTRLCTWDPIAAEMDLVDVVMASAALPIAFPPQTIPAFGDTLWIDGGTGIDTIPTYTLVNNPNVTTVYIICYSSALKDGGAQLPWYLNGIKLLKNTLAVINDMRVDLYAGAIDIAKKSPKKTYSYIPTISGSFSALDFDDEKEEWTEVYQWALLNSPIALN